MQQLTSRAAVGAALMLLLMTEAACAPDAPPVYGSPPSGVSGVPVESYRGAIRRVGTIDGLFAPECARHDPDQDAWLISNIVGFGSLKNNEGYIVRVSARDFSRADVLVHGGSNGVELHAPKGMVISGDTLWVADIDHLRAFHRVTGKPLAAVDFRPHGAVMLNDIAVGSDGALRVTDTGIVMSDAGIAHVGGDRIFVLGPGRQISLLAEGPELKLPNGIVWDATGSRWIVASFDPHHAEVYAIPETGARAGGVGAKEVLVSGGGRFDGLYLLRDGRVLYTSWRDSTLNFVRGGRGEPVLRKLVWPAAIGVDESRRHVAIPEVLMGRVEIWELPPA